MGLKLDESSIEDRGKYTCVLDIRFKFDDNGDLQTDLFLKETDSREYLSYSSAHPDSMCIVR